MTIISPDNATPGAILGPDGELAGLIRGYRERRQQIDMANDVAGAIAAGTDLLVEAGTGTGKTWAYLVPIVLSRVRAIVSTGTKTLQDQLFLNDLPVVLQLEQGRGIKVALLKGRANYLCPERLDRKLKTLDGHADASELVRVREWSERTRTGDITELLDVEREAHLVPSITSTAENCLGNECPRVAECPLYRARARAADADIVIVNHHLLFADMALQDDNLAPLLPDVDAIVVDEAHQVPEIARHFFGLRIGSGQLFDLCRDIQSEIALLGADDMALIECVRHVESATQAMNDVLAGSAQVALERALLEPAVAGAIERLDFGLGNLATVLDAAAVRSRGLANCYQRATRLLDRFAMLTEPAGLDGEYVQWLEVRERGFSIHLTPVSIASHFGERVRESRQTWILTSATLEVADRFDYMVQMLGISGVRTSSHASPFDFFRQVKAWIPEALPAPGNDAHTDALVAACLPIIREVPGRTFFLFTSYRALARAATLFAASGLAYLVQGDVSRTRLLERFRRTERCVLLATQSFWEGVDVRGARLQCLIIDKLPFANPDDPITGAQMRAMDRAGGNGFMDYLVPDAAISLRQGFGRLVREENDRGLFVLGDPRITTKPYGRSLLACLPDMAWLESQAACIEYVQNLEYDESAGD